jgi:DNA-binding transcriptional ArsR family regulator
MCLAELAAIVYRRNTMKRPARSADDLARRCRALAHPLRLEILLALARDPECRCGDIVERMPRAQSTISQHLKILRQAGLVAASVRGPRRCYCLSPEALRLLRGDLSRFLDQLAVNAKEIACST